MKTEEKTQHTKGEWTLGDQNGHCGISIMEGENRVATAYLGTISSEWKWGEETFKQPENVEAMGRARRIVAAVNSCESIPTEALENGVVEILIKMLETLNEWMDMPEVIDRQRSTVKAAIVAVLAKAKGE